MIPIESRSPVQDLVFDIGLNIGEDAAYYISRGYRVIGVEANPILAEECRARFASDVEGGRLVVVNAGVLREPGEFIFYRSLKDHGWSSFDAARAKSGGEWEEIPIKCVTTADLISTYGLPYFMKVDIEGADIQTLYSLRPEIAPAYISLELNHSDPIIEKLIELGYESFKLVNGDTYRPNPPIFEHELGWRLVRKASNLAPGLKQVLCQLPEGLRPKYEFDPPGKHSPDGYTFGAYSSGPFGEQAAGEWMSASAALKKWEALKRSYRRAGLAEQMWWDVHGRHKLSIARATSL